MKHGISLILALALLLAPVAMGEIPGDDIEAILSGMTLEEKVGQMMIVSFRVWKEMPEGGSEGNQTVENAEEEIPAVNVTELNDPIRQSLADYHFGGTLLFAENCRDAEQVARLVADLQATNQAGGGLPLLVCADQEGGSVARLGFGTTGPGNMALAATGDPENARTMAAIYGTELSLLGINADFAPVIDVNSDPNNPVIGIRSFSDDAGVVSQFGGAYIDGLHSTGTIATIKHFPGHGNTDTDSHTGLPLIDRSYEELRALDLIPFQSAINDGADMVMTAHIQFPQIESETYTSVSTGEKITLPATMSKALLTDILRGDMGFTGVVVTDALDMGAIHDNFTDEDVIRLTINAGADMLILPVITDTDLFQRSMDMVDTAVRLVRDGAIDEARIDESVRRILTLKKKYGILDETDFAFTDEQAEAAVNGVGSAEHRDTAWDIAQKALTLVKNDGGAFPVRMADGETALILFADSCASRAGTGELAAQMLTEQGALPEGAAIAVMVNDAENGEACVRAATEADHVILVNRMYNAACLDPNTGGGFSTAVFDEIIEARHAAGKAVVVVSCQLPYDAARFTDADAILLTYGGGVMRAIPPTEGAGSAYAPNLAAGLCACFGVGEANGKPPVSLPALDDSYAFTDEVLYKASTDALDIDSLARVGWQKTAVFPDWKGYTDDTLAMNSMISFQGYRGQGTLWISVSDAVEAFTLYVNEHKVNTSMLSAGTWHIDISGFTVDGMNTVQVSNILPMGLDGAVEVCVPYPVVLDCAEGLEGLRPEALRLVSDIIQSDIDHGFTSAQLAVVRNGRLVINQAWGTVNAYNPDGTPKTDSPATTVDTLYDLASVTKMFSINYAVQKLVTDGKLSIDAPIVDFLGEDFAEATLDIAYAEAEEAPGLETQKAWKRALTVRDLLRHQAGFPAGPRYCNPDFDMSLLNIGEPGSNLCYAANRSDMLTAICKTPLLYEPGTKTVYSDVDYILLTFVVEAVTGQRLDDYMEANFYAPLGLEHITYLPLEHGYAPDDCAATELNGNTRDGHVAFEGIRTRTLQGEVHDELAWYCMEGVSGHAGLFANAADLATLASVMLTGGYGEHRFFSRNVIDLFTAPKAHDFGQWGLGWWREGDDQRVWYFGTQASSDTIGHQGWTGTLVMVDPSRNLVIAYLTNKINTRITDEANLNGFDGSCYTASTLGFVPQILSIGMDGDADVSEQLLDLLADMAAESVKLIPEGADAGHPYVKNAQSKIEVLRSWAAFAGNADYVSYADTIGER